jgi:hypothetical protein
MHVPRAAAQTATQGRWSTVLDPNNPTQPLLAPINPVHAALMPNGKVLIIAGSGSCSPGEPGCPTGAPYGPSNGSGAALYDPLARAFTAFSLSWDMFCNGMVLLPSGNALIAGGTSRYDPDFTGQPKTAIFDPWANTFTTVQNMSQGRWYPTVTTLGDGRVMAFSGINQNGRVTRLVEIYTTGSGWAKVSCFTGSGCWTPPLYPWMHLLPNGKVFFSGPDTDP